MPSPQMGYSQRLGSLGKNTLYQRHQMHFAKQARYNWNEFERERQSGYSGYGEFRQYEPQEQQNQYYCAPREKVIGNPQFHFRDAEMSQQNMRQQYIAHPQMQHQSQPAIGGQGELLPPPESDSPPMDDTPSVTNQTTNSEQISGSTQGNTLPTFASFQTAGRQNFSTSTPKQTFDKADSIHLDLQLLADNGQDTFVESKRELEDAEAAFQEISADLEDMDTHDPSQQLESVDGQNNGNQIGTLLLTARFFICLPTCCLIE